MTGYRALMLPGSIGQMVVALLIFVVPFHTSLKGNIPHKTPQWVQKANAYEVNLRNFTEEGTVDAFAGHLQRLKDMGVDVLIFLPVYPIGQKNREGSLGNPYSIRDFTGFNREFGHIDDFKKMVRRAHQLGMHVVLDWEPRHTAPDHVWLEKHVDWFETKSGKEAVLDYDNEDMCSEMKDAMHYWVDDIGIDGYRCFHAGEVPGWFWEDIWTELEVKRPLLGIAAEEQKTFFDQGFDMVTADKLYTIIEKMGKTGEGGKDLEQYMDWRKDSTKPGDLFLNYITNFQLNTTRGPLRDRIGNRTKILTILSILLDGMPMIMGGQEAALSQSLPCCDKALIPWYSYIRAPFFKQLFDLRHQRPSLAAGPEGGRYRALRTNSGGIVVSFLREKGKDRVFYEMNLEDRHYIFQFLDKVPEGIPMYDFFTHEAGDLKDLNKQYTTAERMEFKLWVSDVDK